MLDTIVVNKALISSLALISSTFLIYYLIKKRIRKYEKVAKISQLFIYPVKSLSGVEVNSLTIDGVPNYGKYRDRQFMLIDGDNRFITLRTEPTLVKIKLSLHNQNEIWFNTENFDTLKIRIKESFHQNEDFIDTKVWGQSIQGLNCGQEASEWFSKFLSKPNIRLIQHVSSLESRPSNSRGVYPLSTEKKFPIVYQDGAGVYLTNESSLNDLNSRLEPENRVTHRNFRPNIIVTDCPQYAEDNWLFININGLHLKYLVESSKCLLTTVNTETGQKGSEPLETLRKYRLSSNKSRFGQSPLFGIYLGPENKGTVSINDTVYAEIKTK